MSMGGGGSIRTIWITIRAMNYASQVFNSINKDIGSLIGIEGKLGRVNQQLMKTTTDLANAGVMFATLAQQMAGSILNMAMSSRQGAGDMARLKQQIFLTTNALNNAAYEFLKSSGALSLLNNILKEIQKNKGLQVLIIGGIALISVIMALIAVVYLVNAAMGAWMIINQLMVGPILKVIGLLGIQINTMNMLAISTAAAFGAFTVVFILITQFKQYAGILIPAILAIAAAFIFLASTQAAASLGLTAPMQMAAAGMVAGSLAGGAALLGGFAGGTQSVQKTGPVFAHKGEVIYNPATNRPAQVGNDMGRGGSTTNMNTQITIENVHTKADYDDVAYQINKANRMGARSVR